MVPRVTCRAGPTGETARLRRTLPAMPAPLGNRPTRKMPEIQVFGRDDSPETRAALRFFRERRVVVHYVDLKKRPIAAGELKRFTERLGPAALLDTASRAYRDGGLGYLSMDDAGIVARLQKDPRLLRLPLARHGNEVTVGAAEARWSAWVRPRDAS
jgi:arsenate reductase